MLLLASQGKAKCCGCFMSLMEVFYRVWKDESKQACQLAYQQCLALPIEWLDSRDRLLADAWIAACAAEQGAPLLPKDAEFEPLPVVQEFLPMKVTNNRLAI
jgi:hypothetical protein